ncbi:phosphoadenosine phosphosulfate reductase family protein [Besnoitia besnoiti]|uniref:FAD synthase n=1 Tax=Besnoitia besnoiti TaxID=94643 RepID=A0A2A9MNA2_BESBE|nr:phosphoadenosine phosphosulfate reductase family protein [Besnoitia besnoiti]PFH37112.1 phosphoadenosine phosphosulfate reductase family protein [Besnoitia besnoiti]
MTRSHIPSHTNGSAFGLSLSPVVSPAPSSPTSTAAVAVAMAAAAAVASMSPSSEASHFPPGAPDHSGGLSPSPSRASLSPESSFSAAASGPSPLFPLLSPSRACLSTSPFTVASGGPSSLTSLDCAGAASPAPSEATCGRPSGGDSATLSRSSASASWSVAFFSRAPPPLGASRARPAAACESSGAPVSGEETRAESRFASEAPRSEEELPTKNTSGGGAEAEGRAAEAEGDPRRTRRCAMHRKEEADADASPAHEAESSLVSPPRPGGDLPPWRRLRAGTGRGGRRLWSRRAFAESVALLRRIEAAIVEGNREACAPADGLPAPPASSSADAPKRWEEANTQNSAAQRQLLDGAQTTEEVGGVTQRLGASPSSEGLVAPASMGRLLDRGLQLLVDVFRLFGPRSVVLSFNGGKDAVAALHLYRAALAKHLLSAGEANAFPQQGRLAAHQADDQGRGSGAAPGAGVDAAEGERQSRERETAAAPAAAEASERVPGDAFTELERPKAIYFHGNDEEFEEVAAFVETTAQDFELDICVYRCGLAEGMDDFVTRFSDCRPLAFVLGTREGDPNAADLLPLQASSSWLPAFLRVHPLVGFHYGHIWRFIRCFALPYCELYDRGYTSIGTKKNTRPNPHLFCRDTGRYAPAYLLERWEDERAGRDNVKKYRVARSACLSAPGTGCPPGFRFNASHPSAPAGAGDGAAASASLVRFPSALTHGALNTPRLRQRR